MLWPITHFIVVCAVNLAAILGCGVAVLFIIRAGISVITDI